MSEEKKPTKEEFMPLLKAEDLKVLIESQIELGLKLRKAIEEMLKK